MEAAKQVLKFKEFIQQNYLPELISNLSQGNYFLKVNFQHLAAYDPELAYLLLEQPDDVIKAGELAIDQFDLDKEPKPVRIRIINSPLKEKVMIRDIRSSHLGKFVVIDGVVRQKSDVRPQIEKAKFECPQCGSTQILSQQEKTLTEPKKCISCGYKGNFALISKTLFDVQGIVLEETTGNLDGGEQPKRLNIFLKEDLVSPMTDKKTNPGNNVRVHGVLKEVTLEARNGGQKLVKYDLILTANNIEPLEEDYSNIKISKQEEKEILALSEDPRVAEKLITSLAPGIYGHDRVKEAILLCFLGGVQKQRSDGVKNRGDTHILLIGDPGCIAGDSLIALHNKGLKRIDTLGTKHLQKINEKVCQIRKNPSEKEYDLATTFQHYKQQPVLKIKTETGKEVVCTFNQPFMTKKGWKRADELSIDEEIRVMPKIPNRQKSLIRTNYSKNVTQYVTEDLASLFGYLIGDGHVRKYEVVCYVNNDEKDLIPKISKLFQTCFLASVTIGTKKPPKNSKIIEKGETRLINSTQNLNTISVTNKKIAEMLKPLSEKRVPKEIFQSPKKVISKFISWLFEADGCCFSKGRGKTSIQLKSNKIKLLQDVQQLLLFFGIQGRIIENNLCIRRTRDMLIFDKEIGFISKKKKNKLNKLILDLASKNNQQKIKTPQRFEKVIIIEPEGIMDVFDFEVPKSHSFVANGILCHNSGKSQLLKRAAVIAPKGRYVSGKGASGAGLCVSPNSCILTNPGGIECIKDKIDPLLKTTPEYRKEIWKEENEINFKVQSMSNELKIQSKKPSAVWKLKAPDFVYEINLRSGKKIELTGNTQLFSINNGETLWKKSMFIQKGDYVATPRKLVGGDNSHIKTLDCIKSNPTVHDVKHIVKKAINKISKEQTIRNLAKDLGVNENNLYHNWVNNNSKGNIKLNIFKDICKKAKIDYYKYVKKVSLYNGKNIIIPKYLSKDFFYVAGLIAGDGDIRKNNKSISCRLSNKEEKLHKIYQKLLKNEFKINFDVQEGNSFRSKATRCSSKILGELFAASGIPLSPKSNKIEISDLLLHTENKTIAQFIAGLWDSDGCVSIRNTKGSNTLEYYSCSEKIIRQLQYVLLRFGISSKVRTRKPNEGIIKGKLNKWILEIRGAENFSKFLKNIPLRHTGKKSKLNKIQGKTEITNIDIIPGIQTYLKKRNIKLKNYSSNISYNGIKKIAKQTKDENLSKLSNSDIFWEQVINVKKKKPDYKYVYDLTVEDSHNFVVDGVLVHNTASVVKDEFLGGWALEAGALVLANKGIVLIDELDKMSDEDRSAMHEALEQQTVTISKANIQATLRCETTVLAAANPKLGRFDPYESLAKQINLPPALINRFDLIFPFRDEPDAERDEIMAKFILNMHKDSEVATPDVETDLLRKYIIYARQNIHPKLTENALLEIKTYYVKMRNSNSESDNKAIPISARQLEALIRLTEASAKVRLSQKATKRDAQKAVNLLHFCLTQIGVDKETGQFDIDKITTGVTTSQRGKVIVVREMIRDLEEKIGKEIPIKELAALAESQGVRRSDLDDIIERLKRSGDIFEPNPDFISRI